MDRRKVEKVAALATALTVTALSFVPIGDWHDVGIYAGCSLHCRVLWPFFHASFLHAALNAWCLLSIVFIYDVRWRLPVAFLVAFTIPVNALSRIFCSMAMPTVGLSGVVYFLFGSISFDVARKWYFQGWMLLYLAAGFLFPRTNAWLHVYCYLAGLLVALLIRPIKLK